MAELTPAQVLAGIQAWAQQQYQEAGQKVEVALHGGRFSVADLERYSTRTLACRIALEGLKFEVNGAGRLIAHGHVVVVVLAGDGSKAGSRALNVLAVGGTLQAALPGSKCGLALEDSVNAKDLRSANLYHAGLDKAGTAAWVLTWPVKFNHPRVR
ncbi:hypothetical protein FBY03_111105 [Pseudomonas sp. SJZ079]|uniref:hypothetical protein n=1 Tax=Pseudomonas sp. SJZ079 TaxID=2572887 RepID=UPI001199E900|nr:hypothetical protein [Pseudomonas sp. SJZ079]TWC35057.1 hypothetical protein FBY03_111105 [Pseudomonas sp. SJZ079]